MVNGKLHPCGDSNGHPDNCIITHDVMSVVSVIHRGRNETNYSFGFCLGI